MVALLGAGKPAISSSSVKSLMPSEPNHFEYELQEHQEETSARLDKMQFIRMREDGTPPPRSSPPPRPPDPVEIRRTRLSIEKEETDSWCRNLRKNMATFLAEMEAFRAEMRNEFRQLRLLSSTNLHLLDCLCKTKSSLVSTPLIQPPRIQSALVTTPLTHSPKTQSPQLTVKPYSILKGSSRSIPATGGVKKLHSCRLGTVSVCKTSKYQKQMPQFQRLLGEITTMSTKLKNTLASLFPGESPDDKVMVTSEDANELYQLVGVDVRQDNQGPTSGEYGREHYALHLFVKMPKSNGLCFASCGRGSTPSQGFSKGKALPSGLFRAVSFKKKGLSKSFVMHIRDKGGGLSTSHEICNISGEEFFVRDSYENLQVHSEMELEKIWEEWKLQIIAELTAEGNTKETAYSVMEKLKIHNEMVMAMCSADRKSEPQLWKWLILCLCVPKKPIIILHGEAIDKLGDPLSQVVTKLSLKFQDARRACGSILSGSSIHALIDMVSEIIHACDTVAGCCTIMSILKCFPAHFHDEYCWSIDDLVIDKDNICSLHTVNSWGWLLDGIEPPVTFLYIQIETISIYWWMALPFSGLNTLIHMSNVPLICTDELLLLLLGYWNPFKYVNAANALLVSASLTNIDDPKTVEIGRLWLCVFPALIYTFAYENFINASIGSEGLPPRGLNFELDLFTEIIKFTMNSFPALELNQLRNVSPWALWIHCLVLLCHQNGLLLVFTSQCYNIILLCEHPFPPGQAVSLINFKCVTHELWSTPISYIIGDTNFGSRDDAWCWKSCMLAAGVDNRTDDIDQRDILGERALNAILVECSVAIDPWMFVIVLKVLTSSVAKEVHVSRRIYALDQFMEALSSTTNVKACECGAGPLLNILPLLIQLTWEDQAWHLLVKGVFQRHLSDYFSKFIENIVSNLETSQCVSIESSINMLPLKFDMVDSSFVYGDEIMIQLLRHLSSSQSHRVVKPSIFSCFGDPHLTMILYVWEIKARQKSMEYLPFEYYNYPTPELIHIFLGLGNILSVITCSVHTVADIALGAITPRHMLHDKVLNSSTGADDNLVVLLHDLGNNTLAAPHVIYSTIVGILNTSAASFDDSMASQLVDMVDSAVATSNEYSFAAIDQPAVQSVQVLIFSSYAKEACKCSFELQNSVMEPLMCCAVVVALAMCPIFELEDNLQCAKGLILEVKLEDKFLLRGKQWGNLYVLEENIFELQSILDQLRNILNTYDRSYISQTKMVWIPAQYSSSKISKTKCERTNALEHEKGMMELESDKKIHDQLRETWNYHSDYPRKHVSAVWDFPPFCGRNAVHKNELGGNVSQVTEDGIQTEC